MPDRSDAVSVALGGAALDGGGSPTVDVVPLEIQACLVGGYQWVERRLFEVLGAWVGSEPVPEAQLLFDVYSLQHAWHAELFADRLPTLDSIDPATLTVPPTAGVDRALLVLAGGMRHPDGEPNGAPGAGTEGDEGRPALTAGGTLLRLVGLGRVVLPRLVSGYGRHLRRLSPVAEAPLHRALRLVLRDELDQWQAVEMLTESLLRRPNDIAVVSGYQQHLEQMVAEAGAGLVPWPGPGPGPGGAPVAQAPPAPGPGGDPPSP